MGLIAAIFSGLIGLIEWLCLSSAENAVTDVCLNIIWNQADIASQYNPLCGALIKTIPVIFTVGPVYAILRKIGL